jgi:hypothetical protein
MVVVKRFALRLQTMAVMLEIASTLILFKVVPNKYEVLEVSDRARV